MRGAKAFNIIIKLLFGIYLLAISSSYILSQSKEVLVPNSLQDGQLFPFADKKTDFFDSMTGVQLMEYLKWSNANACERIGYFGGTMLKNLYEVFMDGQKAICMDNGTAPPINNCIVYSIGINNEWSFDDTMESYGCQVYSFDPTMDKEEHNRTSKIHFYPIGLSYRNEVLELGKGEQIHSMNANSNTTSFKMMTLSSIYRMLSSMHGENATIDYLKIDIESGEWGVIPELIESGVLERVRQMSIEIHLSKQAGQTLTELRNSAKILHRLETEGNMVRFDSKPNGIASATFTEIGNMKGYFAFELAWYNKKYHQ